MGQSFALTQVLVCNDDVGTPAGTGEVGEVWIRSPSVSIGYWNKPEATVETLRGGWLHTGDMGHLDEDGYLFITDRTKDLIISGGSNIYPREIEEALLTHPAVRECAVVGVPDKTWGESVKGLVVLREGKTATDEELIAHCRDRMASYKKPKSIEFLPDLPKNATGKILKRELREHYWRGCDRRV